MGAVGKMTAIGQWWDETGRQVHSGDQSAGLENARQAVDQVDIANVGGCLRACPAGIVVAQRNRMYRHGSVDGALEQRTMERQQRVARGGGAFGKDGQTQTGVEGMAHLLVGVVGRLAAAAFDEHGIGLATEPADQWPLPDLALGYEGAGKQGVDDENVDERDVVAHQQAAFDAGQAIAGFDPDAQYSKKLPRPDSFELLSPASPAQAEQRSRLERAEQEMQSDQEQPNAGSERSHQGRIGGLRYRPMTLAGK